MNVGILCPGPSLAAFLQNPVRHGGYCAVNRAAEAWPCSWWVCNDAAGVEHWKPVGTPRLYTSRDHESWATTCPRSANWRQFSMCSAVVLCELLGCTGITIYGCDWEGDLDWDGRPALGPARHADRWRNEQHSYGQVCGWLQQRGVSIGRKAMVKKDQEQSEAPQADAPKVESAAKWTEHRVVLRRPMQVGDITLDAGECIGVISAHPQASVNFIVDGVRYGSCSIIP